MRRRRFGILICISAALFALIALDRAGFLLVPSGDDSADEISDPQAQSPE